MEMPRADETGKMDLAHMQPRNIFFKNQNRHIAFKAVAKAEKEFLRIIYAVLLDAVDGNWKGKESNIT